MACAEFWSLNNSCTARVDQAGAGHERVIRPMKIAATQDEVTRQAPFSALALVVPSAGFDRRSSAGWLTRASTLTFTIPSAFIT